ncbi:enoyl-CoA delta isomerase 2, mitochondrial [Trichogramma pretiosum]|uniref:enoyl-CoA delta isomerase 2, mitochondrial n=1 Tax=Trichogramma pretiosum TaxID=7493 RepID=UPI0006C9E21F|nr:enoyl-CoA delta isomerase 2, mitochondrial [Trichogramma pretiosum]XP_014222267.1 enoyl-CoA delta isomerase 2, mitochondrial [Trichogramma pretiosum]XP_014222268.1 enoyl-CoA delta isomerase 2, mitochondrial [Trichogramma pretiosum]XP_023317973.1 enoyl-CoA delta isomerase 2, mitochondrial [Trichogramma pretiosum]XP_023317974.1 enoyl-CoA delta isomerase 2, mitochondrial [Trichogramma pretiosum]
MSQYIATSIEGSIQRIVIDRPRKRNAINGPMYREMIKILDESAKNREVTCLAITGTGDFYSSGNDFVSNLTAADESATDVDAATLIIQNFVDTLINYPKLLIAVVNGPAIGIMATTLALFDIVYAAETVYISTPFSKLGLSAEGCSTYTFPRIMGPSKAAEMLYFGVPLSAKEAADVGLVSRVYKKDAVDEIWEHLRKISTLSPESIVATKQLISHWNKDILMKVNRKELEVLKKIYMSPQFLERMANFMMKKSKL